MSSKAKAYRIHVAKRSLQRIGFELSRETLDGFVRQIQTGTGVFVEKQSLRVSKWLVWHETTKRHIPVIYDKARKAIVTVLPLDAVSGEFRGKTLEKWSERLDSNQRPLTPQDSADG